MNTDSTGWGFMKPVEDTDTKKGEVDPVIDMLNVPSAGRCRISLTYMECKKTQNIEIQLLAISEGSINERSYKISDPRGELNAENMTLHGRVLGGT